MSYAVGGIGRCSGRPIYYRRSIVAWMPLDAGTPVFLVAGHTVGVLDALIKEGLLPKYEFDFVSVEVMELAKQKTMKRKHLSRRETDKPIVSTYVGVMSLIRFAPVTMWGSGFFTLIRLRASIM